jgi:hypothetical protein
MWKPASQISAVNTRISAGARAAVARRGHFHVVVLDGVFSEGDDGSVTFHEATHLCADDVQRLERTLQRRVLRLFQRRRLLDEHTARDMLTWQASGGFSLDASVRIHGSDSSGRERLLRYCARPPFALERLRIESTPQPVRSAAPPARPARPPSARSSTTPIPASTSTRRPRTTRPSPSP